MADSEQKDVLTEMMALAIMAVTDCDGNLYDESGDAVREFWRLAYEMRVAVDVRRQMRAITRLQQFTGGGRS